MFIDAHAHLDDHYFDDPVARVLDRAFEAGVGQLVVVGCGVPASENAVRLASEHPGRIFAAVGVHPHDVQKMTDADFDAIAALAREPEVVAVGETGLDYHYDHSPREAQREAFARFLDLAKAVDKPVVVHTREAEADTVSLLKAAAPLPASGQIHCFTGTMALAGPAVDLGLYVSFSGVVTFNNADGLRECVRQLPLDRLLIETDCPYLTPAPFRGRKNEPMLVPVVAGTLAAEKRMTVAEVAEATTANAQRLFRLPAPPATRPLAFASGRVLHLMAEADAAAVLAAAERHILKKIDRVLVHGEGPAASDLEAWARAAGKPVERAAPIVVG
jgi:TatD DNase family protein